MTSPKSKLDVVFGAMTFGKEGKLNPFTHQDHPIELSTEQARVHTIEDCKAILDVFQKHGHSEIDTARFYANGTSEEYLGALDWQSRGIVMDTKFFPTRNMPSLGKTNSSNPEGGWTHSPEHIRQNVLASLKALKTDKVDMWYLHGPDRSTPYEVTLQAVNEMYEEGYFKRFGISNYMAWEVAQMSEICERNGWVKPTVYQGIHNALHRAAEPELFPCLRHYGISFYNYNPLAGGYLTDRYHRNQAAEELEPGSRFDPKRVQGQSYRARYWNDAYFDALDILRPVAKKHGLTEAECALRWMNHHSGMRRESGDKIIIGASSVGHLESNMKDLEKGPLPEEVVQALDQGWERCKGVSIKYYH